MNFFDSLYETLGDRKSGVKGLNVECIILTRVFRSVKCQSNLGVTVLYPDVKRLYYVPYLCQLVLFIEETSPK